MLFNRLTIQYFGKFQNCELELKPGINLIYGENEAGKSTIHSFIKGMLFGIERLRGRGAATKDDIYTRYLPWDYPGAYGGTLDLTVGDMKYRLTRSFHGNNKSFTIQELSTGREVKLGEGAISELVPGLTEAAFRNTISIEQLRAQTDMELALQVRNYIANLSVGMSNELNVAKAIDKLTEQKKQLEAAKNSIHLVDLKEEIELGIRKEEQLQGYQQQSQELKLQEQKLKQQLEEMAKVSEGEEGNLMLLLPGILEKYNTYRELDRQYLQLELRGIELQVNIEGLEKKQDELGSLQEAAKEVRALQLQQLELQRNRQELLKVREEVKKKGLKYRLFCGVPASLLGTLAIPVLGFRLPGLLTAILIYFLGLLTYYITSRRNTTKGAFLLNSLSSLEQVEKEQELSLKLIIERHSVNSIEELLSKQEQASGSQYGLEHAKAQAKELLLRRNEVEDQRDAIYDAVMSYLQHFIHAEDLTEQAIEKLREVIYQRKAEHSDKFSEISLSYENCRLQLERLSWEIEALEDNAICLEKNKALLEEKNRQLGELELELEAVRLALSTISELSREIHDSFGQKINQAVSSVIADITNQKYTDLKVDEKLEVKANHQGNYVLLDRLSAGTIDQIYFALRLAVADLFFGENGVPILLDDSLVLYDDTRAARVLSLLADRSQVILFTCQRREQRIIEEMGIPYHFVDLTNR